jgi:hypothetical protein
MVNSHISWREERVVAQLETLPASRGVMLSLRSIWRAAGAHQTILWRCEIRWSGFVSSYTKDP